MAGIRVAAVKAALLGEHGALKQLPGLAGVQVEYSYPAAPERACVYGDNSAVGTVSLSAMRGPAGRLKREENTSFGLVIMITEPGQPGTEKVEARATELGAAIEEYLAANPTCGDVPDVKVVQVVQVEMDSGVDDDSATAVLTYQLQLKSHIA